MTVFQVPHDIRRAIETDYKRFAGSGLPKPLEDYLRERYKLDMSAEYAGHELKNPWGKASGQLSMTARQVEEDVQAGLGFVVLKTVIAQDASGGQAMHEWAIREARMVAEPIVGKSGETGWTISWKGRGWWQSFEEYLQLVRDAQQIAAETGTLIVPSCKYHLPSSEEDAWKVEEYTYTTPLLLQAWRDGGESRQSPMPLEKDFSPTLAGSDRASAQAKVLEWLRTAPRLVRQSVGKPNVRIGLKIFNALFDDDFQLEMLRTIHAAGDDRPDFYVYGNRLFDPEREFDGKQGIAYGGPDLSNRNLRVLSRFQDAAAQGKVAMPLLRWSATGNIVTGRMALEYALRGASSFQLHTFFQLPATEYSMKTGSKTEKALHELMFHPRTGFIAWMYHFAQRLNLPSAPMRFLDIVGKLAETLC